LLLLLLLLQHPANGSRRCGTGRRQNASEKSRKERF
jgi:hypothetical protein